MQRVTRFTFLITLIVALVLPISSNAFGYLNAGGTGGGSGEGHGSIPGGSIGNTPPPAGHNSSSSLPEKKELESETVAAVPEPMTWLLLGVGLAAVALASRSRQLAS